MGVTLKIRFEIKCGCLLLDKQILHQVCSGVVKNFV